MSITESDPRATRRMLIRGTAGASTALLFTNLFPSTLWAAATSTAGGGQQHPIQSGETAMKIMAIGTLKPLTDEQQRKYLPGEVPATLKLYLNGKMEQFWLRDGNAGVIFLMSVASVDEARSLLGGLPLTQAGLMSFELLPIGPLKPLGMLIK
jgi:hypothetical protein